MDDEISFWCSWCEGSLAYLMPLSIAVGIIPFFRLNLLERRKVIFITIVIAFLLFINNYIVDYLYFGYPLSTFHGYFHQSTLIAIFFGTVFSISLNFRVLRRYDVFLLSGIQLTAAMIGILGSFVNFEEEGGWLIQFSPESFCSNLFFLFWNSYTTLFPLNAHIPCGFFTPHNWFYFVVVQVLFNTLYLLLISFLAHRLYSYSHRKIGLHQV
ncbi:MAG: hypothetical protein AB8B69_01270 [Chitinophagales bacterium]